MIIFGKNPPNSYIFGKKQVVFGKIQPIFGKMKIFGETLGKEGNVIKKGYKGKCTKQCLSKCEGICKTYSNIGKAYAEQLEADETVKSFISNVEITQLGFATDFLYTRTDGSRAVRECVYRSHIGKPLTVKLLELSRQYWLDNGIADWGIVVDKGVSE